LRLKPVLPGPPNSHWPLRANLGRTASSLDRLSPLENSKICKAPESLPFHTVMELERWQAGLHGVDVRLHRFAAFRHVYFRIFTPLRKTRLVDSYHPLRAWLAERRLDARDVVFIGMSLDDPPVTRSEERRYDLRIACSPAIRAAFPARSCGCESGDGWARGHYRPSANAMALGSAFRLFRIRGDRDDDGGEEYGGPASSIAADPVGNVILVGQHD